MKNDYSRSSYKYPFRSAKDMPFKDARLGKFYR